MTDRILRLIAAATLLGASTRAAAQDVACDRPDDVEVRHLKFSGNHAFRGYVLANGIHTEQSSVARRWLFFVGKKKCLDRDEVVKDAARIRLYYNERGFPGASVVASIEPPDGRKVSVRFRITEGAPTLLDTLGITGLESVPERDVILGKDLPLQAGNPFDRVALAATIDTLLRRMRDNGYPAAEVLRDRIETDSGSRHATVMLAVNPGTRATIGRIKIEIESREVGRARETSQGTVRRVLGVKEGELYQESRIERGKRNLFLTGVYATSTVDVDSNAVKPPGDSVIGLNVLLKEGYMRSAQSSGGWGTLDCFRVQGDFQHNNFLHDARRFDARLRLTKIGIGRPLSGASALCDSDLRRDPYSTKLNGYAGVTIADRTVSFLGTQPSVTLYTERRSEYLAYLLTTPVGAVFAATRDAERARRTQQFSYSLQYSKTEAQPAILCALLSLCVPEDRETVLGYRRLAVAGWSWRQDWTDNAQYPTRGAVATLDLRHASSAIGSDGGLQFNRATGDVSAYLPLGRGRVLASRFRAGAVVGPRFTGVSKFIPSQERLFTGGANSVRGFSQNDLGPKIYIASGYDTVRAEGAVGEIGVDEAVFFRMKENGATDRSVPVGGSSLLVMQFELRMPSPVLSDLLRFTVFTDMGELWTPGALQSEDKFGGLKVTPGVGMRVITFVGLLGFDVAYNPYAPRAGAAYFDTPVNLGGQLFCVSPGNTLAVTGLGVPGSVPTQEAGSCAAAFQPRARVGFLRKLQLHFAIGHAF